MNTYQKMQISLQGTVALSLLSTAPLNFRILIRELTAVVAPQNANGGISSPGETQIYK